MEYYLYQPAANDFADIGFETKISKQIKNLHRSDETMVKSWSVPTAQGFDDDNNREGDFPGLSNYYQIPVMSQRAWDALSPLIGYCCEALPYVHPRPGTFYLIHVMDTVDALDVERSEVKRFTDGGIMRVVRYALKEKLIEGKPIFRLPLKCGADLIVCEEFRKVVELHDLKGLRFNPIDIVQ